LPFSGFVGAFVPYRGCTGGAGIVGAIGGVSALKADCSIIVLGIAIQGMQIWLSHVQVPSLLGNLSLSSEF
jgi:hypothetical protein